MWDPKPAVVSDFCVQKPCDLYFGAVPRWKTPKIASYFHSKAYGLLFGANSRRHNSASTALYSDPNRHIFFFRGVFRLVQFWKELKFPSHRASLSAADWSFLRSQLCTRVLLPVRVVVSCEAQCWVVPNCKEQHKVVISTCRAERSAKCARVRVRIRSYK